MTTGYTLESFRKSTRPTARSDVWAKRGQTVFFSPVRDDIHWYPFGDVLALIPPPENVTLRHMAIAADVWDEIATVEREI